jgi:phospholipase C
MFAQGQNTPLTLSPHRFKHVIVVVQENRTPDNLFQDLNPKCQGSVGNCYDILPNGLVNGVCTSPGALANYGGTQPDPTNKCLWQGTIQTKLCLEPQKLTINYDPNHTHCAFELMYNQGNMDGATRVPDNCGSGTCPKDPPECPEYVHCLSYKYVDNSTGEIQPYLDIAKRYGWANRMFQTNQGPSYPAHQFLFGGTSAPTDDDDIKANFAAENPRWHNKTITKPVGCLAPSDEKVCVISPGGQKPVAPCIAPGESPQGPLCSDQRTKTMASMLENAIPKPTIPWKYYAPMPGSIWTAPNSISKMCLPVVNGKCKGAPFKNHRVDFNLQDVVGDISDATCTKLAAVSWVIPDGRCSDHAKDNPPPHTTDGGPAWVASIVNAVGKSKCNYWKDTAILITWDDWGGWYDHVKPTILPGAQGDYQYGFRVPLLVVSAYTKPGTISNTDLDFGSILKFIERVFKTGSLGFADSRAANGLEDFFNQDFNPFVNIKAPPVPDYCIKSRHPAPPDDDD